MNEPKGRSGTWTQQPSREPKGRGAAWTEGSLRTAPLKVAKVN